MKELIGLLAELRPDLDDPAAAVSAGTVLVNGMVVTNPHSLVPAGASIRLVEARPLRGRLKLEPALAAFEVSAAGRTALDAGAAAGGFTQVLLADGARKVYAVDAGYGQLLGSLRQDDRVVVLERTNIGALDRTLVPDEIGVVTLDLGYLALAAGVGQLNRLGFAPETDLIALVKPMFELGLAQPPTSPAEMALAQEHATAGITAAGWEVRGRFDSPIPGARGAREFFLHARRAGPAAPGSKQ